METKDTTYAQEAIREHIYKKIENKDVFQDYNESYSDYIYSDASGW